MADTAGTKKRPSLQGVMTAVGCCCILACIGGNATMINITLPSICAGLGITTVQASLQILISTISAFVFGLAGAKFLAFLTPRWSMFAGCVAASICLLIASTTHSYPVFCLSGLFSGFSLSCTFPPIASLMNLHFKEDSGKWFGLATGAQVFIVAGLIKVAGALLKTNDYRFVLTVFIFVPLIVGCSFCFLLVRQPKRSVMLSEMKEAAAKKAEQKAAEPEETTGLNKVVDTLKQGLTIKEALMKPSLYLFSLGMIAGAIITGSMSTYGSSFFVMFGMGQAEAADLMSAYTLFCGVHVLWTGFFQAKFGSRTFIVVQYIAIVVGVVLLVVWANNQSTFFVVAGLLLVALIKPINSTPALLLPDLFGRKHYLEFNSLSNGIYYAGVCISSQSTAAIMTALGGARAFFYMGIMAVVAVVVFVAAIALSPMKKRKTADE